MQKNKMTKKQKEIYRLILINGTLKRSTIYRKMSWRHHWRAKENLGGILANMVKNEFIKPLGRGYYTWLRTPAFKISENPDQQKLELV